MEYVDGHTLREVLDPEGSLPEQHVVAIGAQACAALDLGHRHRVVHGDITLSNIMINRAGAVKVLNFGAAGIIGKGNKDAGPFAERVRGDLYAVGCVLYELLTGRPPYLEGSPARPSTLNPAVSPALDAIVRKALSVDPTDGYQSAAALRADLLSLTGQGTTPAGAEAHGTVFPRRAELAAELTPHPNGSARKRGAGRALVATLTVLIALALTGYWLLARTPPPAQQVPVPALIGLSDADATARLTGVGLRVNRQQQVVSAPEQVGKVVQSDPTVGVVASAGSEIQHRHRCGFEPDWTCAAQLQAARTQPASDPAPAGCDRTRRR